MGNERGLHLEHEQSKARSILGALSLEPLPGSHPGVSPPRGTSAGSAGCSWSEIFADHLESELLAVTALIKIIERRARIGPMAATRPFDPPNYSSRLLFVLERGTSVTMLEPRGSHARSFRQIGQVHVVRLGVVTTLRSCDGDRKPHRGSLMIPLPSIRPVSAHREWRISRSRRGAQTAPRRKRSFCP
jgi:hypothetical protein